MQGGRPNPALHSRLDTAVQEWRTATGVGLEPVVFCLGGIGSEGAEAEAPVMARYLEQTGIPRRCLVEEAHSRTTEENLRHLAAILASPDYPDAWVGKSAEEAPDPTVLPQEVATDGLPPITLVTSRPHLPRALLMAKSIGLDPRGVAAPVHAITLKSLVREVGALAIWGARSLRRAIAGS